MRIWIREDFLNADLCGSGSATLSIKEEKITGNSHNYCDEMANGCQTFVHTNRYLDQWTNRSSCPSSFLLGCSYTIFPPFFPSTHLFENSLYCLKNTHFFLSLKRKFVYGKKIRHWCGTIWFYISGSWRPVLRQLGNFKFYEIENIILVIFIVGHTSASSASSANS